MLLLSLKVVTVCPMQQQKAVQTTTCAAAMMIVSRCESLDPYLKREWGPCHAWECQEKIKADLYLVLSGMLSHLEDKYLPTFQSWSLPPPPPSNQEQRLRDNHDGDNLDQWPMPHYHCLEKSVLLMATRARSVPHPSSCCCCTASDHNTGPNSA